MELTDSCVIILKSTGSTLPSCDLSHLSVTAKCDGALLKEKKYTYLPLICGINPNFHISAPVTFVDKFQVFLWLTCWHWMKGCVEKSPKWRMINYKILLSNCLVFACETKGEFDITSSVTKGLQPCQNVPVAGNFAAFSPFLANTPHWISLWAL